MNGKLRKLAVLLAPLAVVLTGCGTWEDFRANDYSFRKTFQPDDPIQVLSTSNDGYQRRRALERIEEPALKKGSEKDQDAVLELLSRCACKEPQLICRQAAIHTLSKFKDGRAAEALEKAYYAADDFGAEHRSMLRQQTLTAIGKHGHPSGMELLVRVVQAPRVDATASTEEDKDRSLDERRAAARALQHYKGYQATEALVQVLRTEKDVGLRVTANDSLMAITGKKLPPNAKEWESMLNNPETPSERKSARADEVKLGQPIVQTGAKEKK